MAKDVRQNLRTTAEDVDLAQFFRDAVEADKRVACEHCGHKNQVTDWSARANIIRLLLEQGYGKPPAAQDDQAVSPDLDPGKYTPQQRAALQHWANQLGAPPTPPPNTPPDPNPDPNPDPPGDPAV